MNSLAKEEIEDLYEKIMKAIVGGKVFGVPINDKNIKLLVVAAYLYGMNSNLDLFTEIEEE